MIRVQRTQGLTSEIGFYRVNSAAEWISVVGIMASVFVLLSYAVLPIQYTRSHYLSTCLIVSTILINVSLGHIDKATHNRS